MKLLVLTDHSGHTANNSLYGLVREMLSDGRATEIRVGSRGTPSNVDFFACIAEANPDVAPVLRALRADETFTWDLAAPRFAEAPSSHQLVPPFSHLLSTSLTWPDIIWLRVPHPVPANWGHFLRRAFGPRPIFNRPEGVELTTDKSWLLNVPELCAPIARCEGPADIAAFAKTHDAVLKPLHGYGGQGIARILHTETIPNGEVTLDGETSPLQVWLQRPAAQRRYLAMQYLPRITEGDKRIVVVGDTIIGAVLRVPRPGNWLANVSQGARAEASEVSFAERRIVDTLSPKLTALGIVMFGVDTIVGPDGHRLLSEVNTMSVGGLLDLPPTNGTPATTRAAQLLLDTFTAALTPTPPPRP